MCPLFLSCLTTQQSLCRHVPSSWPPPSAFENNLTTYLPERLYQYSLISHRSFRQFVSSSAAVVSFFANNSDGSLCLAGCCDNTSAMSFADEQAASFANRDSTMSSKDSGGVDCTEDSGYCFSSKKDGFGQIASTGTFENQSTVMISKNNGSAKTRVSMKKKRGSRSVQIDDDNLAVNTNANNSEIDDGTDIVDCSRFCWSDRKSQRSVKNCCRAMSSKARSWTHDGQRDASRNSRFCLINEEDRLCNGLRECFILTNESSSVDTLLPGPNGKSVMISEFYDLRNLNTVYEACWTQNKVIKSRQLDQDGYKLRASCVCVRGADENEVLLITSSRDKNRWVIPGGGIEPGESAILAAERETAEEAGVGGTIDRLLGMFENEESSHRTIVFVLRVERELTDWQEKEMGRIRRWFSLADARTMLLQSKPAQLCYLDALELSKPVPPRGKPLSIGGM